MFRKTNKRKSPPQNKLFGPSNSSPSCKFNLKQKQQKMDWLKLSTSSRIDLNFLRKRERLIHGNRTGKYQTWHSVITKCFLTFLINKRSKNPRVYRRNSDAIQKQASQKVIDFPLNQIKVNENKARSVL